MASVNEVYSALKSLANKDERGFITPKVFNTFAAIAQNNIFNSLFDEVAGVKSMRGRLRNLDEREYLSFSKRLKEDLAYFSKEATIGQSSGVFEKPEDLARIISMKTHGAYVFGTSTSTPIEVLYDESKIEYVLHSDLSAPSSTHPVAILSNVIEVFPTTIKKIKLRYYKLPEGINPVDGSRTALTPRYNALSLGASNEVFDPSTSVDFELPEYYTPMIIMEIAKMIGIHLKDQDVYAYANSEQVKQNQ